MCLTIFFNWDATLSPPPGAPHPLKKNLTHTDRKKIGATGFFEQYQCQPPLPLFVKLYGDGISFVCTSHGHGLEK